MERVCDGLQMDQHFRHLVCCFQVLVRGGLTSSLGFCLGLVVVQRVDWSRGEGERVLMEVMEGDGWVFERRKGKGEVGCVCVGG